MELWAASSPSPRARRTCEGSIFAEVQAEPLERATSFTPIMSVSLSTCSKVILRLPGSRCCCEPLTRTWSSAARSFAWRRSRIAVRRAASDSNSAAAISQAAPKPTMPGTLSVPDVYKRQRFQFGPEQGAEWGALSWRRTRGEMVRGGRPQASFVLRERRRSRQRARFASPGKVAVFELPEMFVHARWPPRAVRAGAMGRRARDGLTSMLLSAVRR